MAKKSNEQPPKDVPNNQPNSAADAMRRAFSEPRPNAPKLKRSEIFFKPRPILGLSAYEQLGVSPLATKDEISEQFRRLSKLTHPDASGGDPKDNEANAIISNAYMTLKDPRRRAKLDAAECGNDSKKITERISLRSARRRDEDARKAALGVVDVEVQAAEAAEPVESTPTGRVPAQLPPPESRVVQPETPVNWRRAKREARKEADAKRRGVSTDPALVPDSPQPAAVVLEEPTREPLVSHREDTEMPVLVDPTIFLERRAERRDTLPSREDVDLAQTRYDAVQDAKNATNQTVRGSTASDSPTMSSEGERRSEEVRKNADRLQFWEGAQRAELESKDVPDSQAEKKSRLAKLLAGFKDLSMPPTMTTAPSFRNVDDYSDLRTRPRTENQSPLREQVKNDKNEGNSTVSGSPTRRQAGQKFDVVAPVEREALIAAEQELIGAETKRYQEHSAIGRVWQRAMGHEDMLRKADLETRMNEAALAYDHKLEDLLAERLDRKGYMLKSKERANVINRYWRMIGSKDVIDRGEKARSAAKREVLAAKESTWAGKAFQWLGKRSQELDHGLGKNGARLFRVFASATAGSLAVAAFGPALAGSFLTMWGIRVARGVVGVSGGMGVGSIAGIGYKKTFGASAARRLNESRTEVAENAEDIAYKRAVYQSGNAEAIAKKRAVVEAVSAMLAGAGLSLGTGYGLAHAGIGVEQVAPISKNGSPDISHLRPESDPNLAKKLEYALTTGGAAPHGTELPHVAIKMSMPSAESLAATAPAINTDATALPGSVLAPEIVPDTSISVHDQLTASLNHPASLTPAGPHFPQPHINTHVPTPDELTQQLGKIKIDTPTSVSAGTEAPIVPPGSPATEISVGVTENRGIEQMMYDAWHQMQGKHIPLPADHHSDLYKLLTADKNTIGGVVHRMALEPKHHFFEMDKSTGIAHEEWVKNGAKMTINEKGNFAFSADDHASASEHIDTLNRVRANLGLKPHLPPETAGTSTGAVTPEPSHTGTSAPIESAVRPHTPAGGTGGTESAVHPTDAGAENLTKPSSAGTAATEQVTQPTGAGATSAEHAANTPPSTTDFSRVNATEFVQQHASEPHLYADAAGKHLTIWGSSYAEQMRFLTEHAAQHPNSAIDGVSADGKWLVRYPIDASGAVGTPTPVYSNTLLNRLGITPRELLEAPSPRTLAEAFKHVVQ